MGLILLLGGLCEEGELTTHSKAGTLEAGSHRRRLSAKPMPQMIDLDGLPDPVAQAIVETVLNLKSRYQVRTGDTISKPRKDLPSRPGRVIGSLRRVDIYEER
jgi:hypothetical protein